jgi:hypothetical protein
MHATQKLRPTLHACTKYAQVVLGLAVNDRELVANPKLHGRCSRGIERLVERAQPGGMDDLESGRSLLVVGTRALVVHEGEVMTLFSSPSPRGFGKKLLRDPDCVQPCA